MYDGPSTAAYEGSVGRATRTVIAATLDGNVQVLKNVRARYPDIFMADYVDDAFPASIAAFQGQVECLAFMAEVCPQTLLRGGCTARPYNAAFASVRRPSAPCLSLVASAVPEALHETLWLEAAFYNSVECLPILEAHLPFNVDIKGDSGNTPAHIAAKLDHTECLEFFVDKCPDWLLKPNNAGDMPSHLACIQERVRSIEVIAKHAPGSMYVPRGNGETCWQILFRKIPAEAVYLFLDAERQITCNCVFYLSEEHSQPPATETEIGESLPCLMLGILYLQATVLLKKVDTRLD